MIKEYGKEKPETKEERNKHRNKQTKKMKTREETTTTVVKIVLKKKYATPKWIHNDNVHGPQKRVHFGLCLFVFLLFCSIFRVLLEDDVLATDLRFIESKLPIDFRQAENPTFHLSLHPSPSVCIHIDVAYDDTTNLSIFFFFFFL